jgi:TRIAD3 protein (E3 ubiquitin-protein ligase RNF216)
MDPFALGQHREIIDLDSDSEDDFNKFLEFESDSEDIEAPTGNNFGHANGSENAIDLTALDDIPDVDVPPDPVIPARPTQPEPPIEDAQLLSETVCLQMILDVLPDISVNHVLTLIQERTQPCTYEECERLITELLDGEAYPKQSDEDSNKHKRKRGDDDDGDITEYENGEHSTNAPDYHTNA